ncbi:S-layer homology domain-containing protein [Orenia metallireducens]|uniref:S-layer homology domain-containing protein n=1 Tax=Orenia metallireducens TaxID=1413210 RepID=A0A285GLT9_9FIRM|nr:S-layer homology domain-containing protein [Orenia metallireducens]SNY24415.1 S-layer homology domain-containing protein [Orenia metallireducens]
MKKLITSFLTLALLFTMSVPAIANPFNDVPEGHWAYDAIQKAAQAGLLEGYGDGTYKASQDLTRYEVAALTARVLEKVETKDNEVSAEAVEAITALAQEFDAELAQINEKLANSSAVTISGKTGVEYNDVELEGNGVKPGEDGKSVVYKDPFTKDLDDDDNDYVDATDYDDDDMITAEDYFKQFADLNVNIEKDGVIADLNMLAVGNYFGNFGNDEDGMNEANVELDEISGSITTEDFVATIGDEQGLEWKNYLYFNDDDIDGVVFNSGNSQIALGQRGDTRDIAVKQDNLLNLPVNLFVGVRDNAERNVVAGLDTAFNLAGVDFTGDLAFSDKDMNERVARLGASKDLGFIKLEGNVESTENFTGIQVDTDEDDGFESTKKGFDLKATKNIDKVEVSALYENYEYATEDEEEITLAAQVTEDNPYTIYGVNVFGEYEYAVKSEEEIRYVEANKELGNITVAGIYDYDNTDNLADKVLSVGYGTEFDVAGIKLAPTAQLAAIYDIDNNQAINKEAGIDASYQVNDKLNVTGGFAWADKEDRVDDGMEGEFTTAKAGLGYKVTDSASATINFERADYVNAVDTNEDFSVNSISGGVSVNF